MEESAPSNLPRRIGRYNVLARIATGGMAELFLGRRVGPRGFQRSVVIKRILPHLAQEQSIVDMFLDEARIAASIQHPNVVAVEDLGQEGEDLFMVMEYLLGESLSMLTRRLAGEERILDADLAAYIIAEACAGLHAAHEMTASDGTLLNVVHRDVSPQNIFISYDGTVKVLDFGIATASDRLTDTDSGLVKGKFAYMSPEHVRDEPLDRRADIFALGINLYEALTFHRLFKRENSAATIRAVLQHEILPPSALRDDVSDVLDEVCLRALARRRRLRYQSAAEMRSALLASFRRASAPMLPEAKLAELMEELFEERARAKREMVQRVQAGEELEGLVVPVPAAPAELPVVGDDLEGRITTPQMDEVPRRRRQLPLVLGLLVALVALTAVAVVLAALRSEGLAKGSSPAVAVDAVEPAKAAPPAASSTGSPVPDTVTVAIGTEPSGAKVEVDGSEPARTPAVLTLPKGSAALAVRVTLAGYKQVEERVVPDVDQRLRIILVAERQEGSKEPRRDREPREGRDREGSDGPREGKSRPGGDAGPRSGSTPELPAKPPPRDRVELWD